ncbi:MAG: class II fructose-bisphosphate aldolase [Proteobacteria bacterium]|nr:class II fructose-bisphosphate aldolase [Pseudomonadota bacterium]
MAELSSQKPLARVLAEARAAQRAIGHFNVSDLVLLKGVLAGAQGLNVPVIVGASEGEREFLGTAQLAALVRSLRDDCPFPIYLNADHTHSLPKALEAARAGFDSVVFDLSDRPLEDNVRCTKAAVEILKGVNPDFIVEGEIGNIGSGSEIHQTAATEYHFTTPADANEFVRATGIDVLAPAVGNFHGVLREMLDGSQDKRLNIEVIRAVAAATCRPLTLHGGSRTNEGDLVKAIEAGITIVHINTELRLAWRQSLAEALASHPDEVVPYKLLRGPVDAVAQIVRAKLRLLCPSP